MRAQVQPLRLLLIGAGHAHAEVLLRFAKQRIVEHGANDQSATRRDQRRGIELIVVSPHRLAPYSGMIPGWLAGSYRWEECCIDFAALAARAHARFIESEVVALDAGARCFTLANGERLTVDLASLNIGSTVATPPLSGSGPLVIATRPLADLRACVENMNLSLYSGRSLALVAVGGGAAGVECLLALRRRLSNAGITCHATLVTRSDAILSGLGAAAVSRTVSTLQRTGVSIQTGFDVTGIDGTALHANDGRRIGADLMLWAPGGMAHRWPAQSGLAVDVDGFVLVDAQLRSVSHAWMHAVGDSASFGADRVPKSGVFSVRMGPILSHNLECALQGRHSLRNFTAQRRHLALINCANGTAIGAWGPFALEGAWVWRWKDRIDRNFVRRYAFNAISTSMSSRPTT